MSRICTFRRFSFFYIGKVRPTCYAWFPSLVISPEMTIVQEAHLLQRDRPMLLSLNISLSYSRSLKVIETGTIRKHGYTVSYLLSIVTMALSCIISEIKRDICHKSRFFHRGVAVETLSYRLVRKKNWNDVATR